MSSGTWVGLQMERFLCSLAFLSKKLFWSLKPQLLENFFHCEDFQRVQLYCFHVNRKARCFLARPFCVTSSLRLLIGQRVLTLTSQNTTSWFGVDEIILKIMSAVLELFSLSRGREKKVLLKRPQLPAKHHRCHSVHNQ